MQMFDKGSEASFIFEIKGAPETAVTDFRAVEELSKPFVAAVSLAGRAKISYDDVIHKEALLTIKGAETERYFHGIVRKFEFTGKSGRKYLYDAEIVPAVKLLSLEQDCRIFQATQVQDIIAGIFKESGISSDRLEFRLKNKEHKRKYCVQYRETDLDFISRLLEEEGIYYFFEHFQDKHVMVFADDPFCCKFIEGSPEITFKPESGLNPEKEVISGIDFSRRLRSGNYAHNSFNFKRAAVDLKTNEQSKDEGTRKYEIYDYPGPYGDAGPGKKIAKIRLEENLALRDQAAGESNCPRMIPGVTFTLDNHAIDAY